MMCKQVLCIDCILNDGHKSHEINSLEKAAGIEKTEFFNYLKNSIELEDKIKAQALDIENHFILIRNQANKNRDSLSKIFNNVRKLINERENELKLKIASVLQEEETYLEEKKEKLNDQLDTISKFKNQVQVIDSDSDITVLQSSEDLHEISEQAMEKPCSVTLKDPFVNVKEDIELMHICKLINPGFSQSSNAKALRSNKYNSGGYKPQSTRTKSKDGRGESLKSTNLLKKGGSYGNQLTGGNKGFNPSPKKPKGSEANIQKVMHNDGDEPNYSKPIHNTKRKNKQHTIGKFYHEKAPILL